MKQLFTTLILLFVLGNVFSQDQVFQKGTNAFNLTVGFGNDDFYYDITRPRYAKGTRYPVMALSLDHGMFKADKVYIGIGGELGYGRGIEEGQSDKLHNELYYNEHSDDVRTNVGYYNTLYVGTTKEENIIYHDHVGNLYHGAVSVSFHFDLWRMTKQPLFKKLDIYAIGTGGVIFETYSAKWAEQYESRDYSTGDYSAGTQIEAFTHAEDSEIRPLYGICGGARFYFSDHFGIMAEAGYKMSSLASVGISIKY